MGRRKQLRPHRSVGIIQRRETAQGESDNQTASLNTHACDIESDEIDPPFFLEVDRTNWVSDEHLDISEVVLAELNVREGVSNFSVDESFYQDSKYSLRFRLCNVNEFVGRIKLGHWPVLSASSISLEFMEQNVSGNTEMPTVILSGSFDGPDDGVSALVHLVSLKFLTLRPVQGIALSEDISSLRVRVEILNSAFDACQSLLDNTRKLWKRSMMSVMAWLRPEVMSSEARYGISSLAEGELNLHMDKNGGRQAMFDVASFYEAIKPSKEYPMLESDMPNLLPELRPYQRRAVYWMVQREKGFSGRSGECEGKQFFSPLCVPVDLVDTCSRIFYNPFSGNISLHPESSSPHVFGGILADEMGLGKTVELLACIFTHRKPVSDEGILFNNAMQVTGDQKISPRRLKKERVECVCGAVSESPKYRGLWVQCDICDAWQHASCVGYSPMRKTSKSFQVSNGEECKSKPTANSQKRARKRNIKNIVVMDGEHICQFCSELIQASHSPIVTGATLIVCPAPILSQWHAEITRHTNPGSLNICIYEGVRNASLSHASGTDISELVSADVVLTTYDALKEDLSHDSDRHEGDRRFMRFQKRYPVIPTLLTRIFWWRICLDEAQMVESNAAAATEMALRLHTMHRWCITGTPIQRRLDDLYGLLKFLKVSPFTVPKWWSEVIRDPYEKRDVGAVEFTHNFFKQIMWRSSKAQVACELQLPPQEESLSWLSFSPIEEHFYQRQHETCVSYARDVIERFKDDVIKRTGPGCVPLLPSDAPPDPCITQLEAAKLLNSLLKLRQACCHPQVGSSGLRSLQQSPMTMEEILQVLVGKTKIEGEEALRRLVVALNGLAGIAVINQDLSQAVLLYREALALAEEHSEDFRLDPLLNLHIHHNLAEILPVTSGYLQQSSSGVRLFPASSERTSKRSNVEECGQYIVKRQKLNGEPDSNLTIDAGDLSDFNSNMQENGLKGDGEYDAKCHVSSRFPGDECMETACNTIKQKYLSVFHSKLSLAQQEFRKSHMQVSDALSKRTTHHTVWWLEALYHIEQNHDLSSDLIRKIGDAVAGAVSSSRSSRLPSCFRSIGALKYYIQTGLDLLEVSRQKLVSQILEIDQTMEKPREEDIRRVRYCPDCYCNGDGPLCVHCELDELFQVYEARLFRANKEHGGMISSAEEAVDLQKKKSALNRFYWNLSQSNNKLASSTMENEENKKKRDAGEKVVVSKSPSELEVVLGVIKSYCKALLGRDGISSPTKQLHLLEGMRREYAHARSLAIAQAQVLRAHDEINMATSRLRLRCDENDKSVDALSSEELVAASVEFSNDKFSSLALLTRIKGQLRYLKGLVLSKQKSQLERPNNSCSTQDLTASLTTSLTVKSNACQGKADEEACPVCHEKLSNQKMVFQCGHVTCCKCFVAMSERRLVHHGKFQDKWLVCPTCRQRTEFENMAYADDRESKFCNTDMLHALQAHENSEAFMNVQGSYGTKIEAVTRRILWIKFMDPKAKVLVFSCWNDVLDVLEHALTANHISHIRMKGGRKSHTAISLFRGQKCNTDGTGKLHDHQTEDKFVQVLLLLIQHGANGLNLLEAQHVVLIEPLLNPAAEAQAISRIHRIGQENRTLVHRFIVKNTVEESIYKLNVSRNTNSFITGNTKNQDQPVLTLKDVESLFTATVPSTVRESNEKPTGSLMHLPPSVAAAVAAERRLREHST